MVRNPSISQISLCWIPRVSWPVHIQEKKTLYSMLWLETANNQALGNFTPWIPVKVQVQRHLFASLLCFLCSLIAIYCLLKGGCIDSVYLLVHRWNLFKVIEFNDRLKLYRYKHLRLEKKKGNRTKFYCKHFLRFWVIFSSVGCILLQNFYVWHT